MLGSCHKSLSSVRSAALAVALLVGARAHSASPGRFGIGAWFQLTEHILGSKTAFPPTLQGLLAWSANFR